MALVLSGMLNPYFQSLFSEPASTELTLNSRYSLITGQKPKDATPGDNTASTNASSSNASQVPPAASDHTNPTNAAPPTMSASMSWESSIPGAFVWGPGGDGQSHQQQYQSATNNTNNNANTNNKSSSNDNQSGQNNSGNPNNVLDLD
jgi:hypothetical protein